MHVGAGIEPQELVGEIEIAVANDAFVRGRTRGNGRQKHRQRADFAAVEPGKQRYGRLFAPVEGIDKLARQHLSIDRSEWCEPGRGCAIRQRARIHRPQRGDIRRVNRGSERRPGLFGRRPAMFGLFQLGCGDHVSAFRDGLREKTSRRGRRQKVHDAEAASGLACDGDVQRIAAEGADVAPDPPQRRDLIQQAVIARYAKWRLGAEFGMCQIAEDADPVIDRDHDYAARGQPYAVIDDFAARTCP